MRRKSLKVGLLRQVREAAEDAMEFRQDPMGALIVRADTVWPPLAARALAALILGCLQSRPDRRPADMAAVLAALREVDKKSTKFLVNTAKDIFKWISLLRFRCVLL